MASVVGIGHILSNDRYGPDFDSDQLRLDIRSPERLSIDHLPMTDPVVLVLAAGNSPQVKSDKRGRAFEEFFAGVLEAYGYEAHTSSDLRAVEAGFEVDVRSTHVLSGKPLVSECKMYTSNLAASHLQQFYGKVGTLRLDEGTDLEAFFVGVPRLTADGVTLARRIERGDPHFRYIDGAKLFNHLEEKGRIPPKPSGLPAHSDDALIVWADGGTYRAVKAIDSGTRLATAVVTWGMAQVPEALVKELAQSEFADELPVEVWNPNKKLSASPPDEPMIIPVSGSGSDFEYQLPASPEFFIGRERALREVEGLLKVVRNGVGRVVVLNAQSGWGKSSLALRVKAGVESSGGVAHVLDTRAADGPQFLLASLRAAARAGHDAGLLTLPSDASFASVNSALSTLASSQWERSGVLLILFDQFEHVFNDKRLTRDFRNLALATTQVSQPLLVGFAWKTDLVGWTEGHPYRDRDAIRGAATVISLPKFGPDDIDTLLRRLEEYLETKLLSELRQRLREYSQGLPWLFKKLASHIESEVRSGQAQEALLAEALNVQGLFESDLAGLTPVETKGLRAIARSAPMLASEAVEVVGSDTVQALVDRRLVVQVGERLDVYWDIFRDFLNTGEIPIKEGYIIRSTVGSVGRLLRALVNNDGELTIAEAMKELDTSETVVYNYSRDLRQMGILASTESGVRLTLDTEGHDLEQELRSHVASALKRHQAFDIATDLASDEGGRVYSDEFAEALEEAFPAIRAKKATWRGYAKSFQQWFEYAELAKPGSGYFTIGPSTVKSARALLDPTAKGRTSGLASFPQTTPRPARELVVRMRSEDVHLNQLSNRERKALADLSFLNVARAQADESLQLINGDLVDADGQWESDVLYGVLDEQGATSAALELLEGNAEADDDDVGAVLEAELRASWADSTRALMGKTFRAWAREAGLEGVMRRRHKP